MPGTTNVSPIWVSAGIAIAATLAIKSPTSCFYVTAAIATRLGMSIRAVNGAVVCAAVVAILACIRECFTNCNCSCVRITEYNANSVSTKAVKGCLYCDGNEQLVQDAEEVLAALRGGRNKKGFWSVFSATTWAVGVLTTGPLLDLICGSTIAAAYKAFRFHQINTAVNQLKPFIRNVLRAKAKVSTCKCNPNASRSTISGLCDFRIHDSDDTNDPKAVKIDKEAAKETREIILDAHEEGSGFLEVIGNLTGLA